MATVTGKLLDFGLSSLNGVSPVLTFQANRPAVTAEGSFLATDPIEVTPDSSGSFTVDLANTDTLVTADVHYTLSAVWRAPDLNYVRADFPQWKIFVPTGGGPLSQLIKAPKNRAMVWTGTTSPPKIFQQSGTLWLNPESGNLYEWRD